MNPRIITILACLLIFIPAGNVISQDKKTDHYDSLKTELDQRLANEEYTYETLEILKHYHHHLAEANPVESIQYLKDGLYTAIVLKDSFEISSINTLIGNLYRDLGLFTKALDHHLKAAKYVEQTGNYPMLAYIHNDIGNIHFDLGNFNDALAFYKKGVRLSQQGEESSSLAVSLNNIGLVYRELGLPDSALHYHQQGLEVRQAIGDSSLLAHSNMYIAEDYFILGKHDKSQEYFEKAAQVYEELNDRTKLGEVYLARGTHELKVGHWVDAIAHLTFALELYRIEHQVLNTIEVKYHLGKAHHGLKNYEKAIEYAEAGLDKAGEYNLLNKQIKCSKLLADIYEDKGDYAAAFNIMTEYSATLDEMRQNELDQKISVLNYQNELEHVYRQLTRSEDENKLKQERLEAIKAKNTALWIAAGIALLLALIILLLFYFKAKNAKVLSRKSQIIEEQNEKIESQNKELRRSKELADSYSEAKTNFVSHVSHEIRTPMNAIFGLSQLLSERTYLKKEDRKLVESIRFSSRKLLSILNDVLDFSKIEAGKIQFESADFNVRELITELTTTFKQHNDKGLEIEYYISSNVPNYINGDSTRLYQILNNLLGNALKFTDEGYVRLNVVCNERTSDNLKLKFEVIDSGRGMSKEKQNEIFEAYNQGESFTYKLYGGTGLGLTITKSLIELQDGQIAVESTLGEGTRFSFEIPYKIAEQKMHITQSNDTEIAEEKDLQGLNILYVEDNEVNQFLAKQILKSWNVQLSFADNGEDALTKLAESKFDVVLMDIQMPVMDGIEATSNIRTNKKLSLNKDLPIIGFTADVMSKTRNKAINAGMNDVIVKPFDKEVLYKLIKKYAC